MTILATIDVPVESFVLERVLSANSGVQVEIEPVVPIGSTGTSSVWLWVTGATVERIERALRADPDSESFRLVDTVNGETLVRVEWDEAVDGLFGMIADTGVTVLGAAGEADAWTITLRFVSHDDLSRFYRRCVRRSLSLDLKRVHEVEPPGDAGVCRRLSDTQYETLCLAFEKGYFSVPREITLQELADELGVSDTAVSQRIRRGIAALLTTTFSEPRVLEGSYPVQ